MDQQFVQTVGWIASIVAILMFFSFFDQIRLNINGRPGSVVQNIAVMVNGMLWVTYGLILPQVNWQIVTCNALGAIVGLITAVTAWRGHKKLASDRDASHG